MNNVRSKDAVVARLLRQHLLKFVILSYGLAAVYPTPGLWIKESRIIAGFGISGYFSITSPKLLLGLLLLCAGLRVRAGQITDLARRPVMLLAGLAANLTVPLVFLVLMVPALRAWHNPEEAAIVLLGLGLVSSMPIAGSSTGWAQATDGDMALCLGLVLGSTLISPLSTPASLRALGMIAALGDGESLSRLAGRDTGSFLIAWVLLPSTLGIITRAILGETIARKIDPKLHATAALALLVLCYVNAASCLPQALAHPDWDFLALTLVAVVGLCTMTFTAGELLGRLMRANRGERVALMFGMGMNNNGTGLVLASLALASQPLVMLPIIVYNLVQHLAAGAINSMLMRRHVTS